MHINRIFSMLIACNLSVALPQKVSTLPFRGNPTDIKDLSSIKTQPGANPQLKSQLTSSQANQLIPFLRSLRHVPRSERPKRQQTPKNGATLITSVGFPKLNSDSKDAAYMDVESGRNRRNMAGSGPFLSTFEAHDDQNAGALWRNDRPPRRNKKFRSVPIPATATSSVAHLGGTSDGRFPNLEQRRNNRRSIYELKNLPSERAASAPGLGFDGRKVLGSNPLGNNSTDQGRNAISSPRKKNHGDAYKNPTNRSGWGDGTPGNTNIVYAYGGRCQVKRIQDLEVGPVSQVAPNDNLRKRDAQSPSSAKPSPKKTNTDGRSYSPGNFVLDIDSYQVGFTRGNPDFRAYGQGSGSSGIRQRRETQSPSSARPSTKKSNTGGRSYSASHFELKIDGHLAGFVRDDPDFRDYGQSGGGSRIRQKREAPSSRQTGQPTRKANSGGRFYYANDPGLDVRGFQDPNFRNNGQGGGGGGGRIRQKREAIRPEFKISLEPSEERSRGTTAAAQTTNRGGSLRQLFSTGKKAATT